MARGSYKSFGRGSEPVPTKENGGLSEGPAGRFTPENREALAQADRDSWQGALKGDPANWPLFEPHRPERPERHEQAPVQTEILVGQDRHHAAIAQFPQHAPDLLAVDGNHGEFACAALVELLLQHRVVHAPVDHMKRNDFR